MSHHDSPQHRKAHRTIAVSITNTTNTTNTIIMSIPSQPQSQSCPYATPPESVVGFPLISPPTVISRIIEEISLRQKGRCFTLIPWAAYTLHPKGYQDLCQQLQSDESLRGFVGDKLRYDYFPSSSRLVLRMLSTLHAQFLNFVVSEIVLQLNRIEGKGKGTSAEFAKKLHPRGSMTIKFGDQKYGRHDPDGGFGHLQAAYPGVVIEVVSCPQKRKFLGHLVHEYILGSKGKIRVVVGFDIEEGTLSVWRSDIITNEAGQKEVVAQQTVINQVFRDSNGNPTRTGGLQLRLRDFGPEVLDKLEGNLCDPIVISTDTLCSFLELAQDLEFIVNQESEDDTPAEWVRTQRRETTPPEEVKYKG